MFYFINTKYNEKLIKAWTKTSEVGHINFIKFFLGILAGSAVCQFPLLSIGLILNDLVANFNPINFS